MTLFLTVLYPSCLPPESLPVPLPKIQTKKLSFLIMSQLASIRRYVSDARRKLDAVVQTGPGGAAAEYGSLVGRLTSQVILFCHFAILFCCCS